MALLVSVGPIAAHQRRPETLPAAEPGSTMSHAAVAPDITADPDYSTAATPGSAPRW
ncbi:hypothetical protein [Plasticicumulans lactativorans]|uniref:hypothetical protein n=1 Tax=Plasticicumulans lactativorans TaxID=1133106 RepID=UPI001404DEF5|nr:hypothetical protein [Plasticicumulans lactativorans]